MLFVLNYNWVYDAPVLHDNNEYVCFVDSIIRATLPDIKTHPGLFDLVVAYQIHSHSKSCRKYKNEMC